MTGPRYRLIALHGFLGAPADWEPLAADFPDASWDALDLWEIFGSSRVGDWAAIGNALEARLRELVRAYPMLDYVWLWQSESLGLGAETPGLDSPLDVLVQHLVTVALGGGFDPDGVAQHCGVPLG